MEALATSLPLFLLLFAGHLPTAAVRLYSDVGQQAQSVATVATAQLGTGSINPTQ